MDIQTASSVSAMLASPLIANIALVTIPVLFTGLIWTFRQQYKHLNNQFRDSLDLIAAQNKEMVMLKATVSELEENQTKSRDHIDDLKQQIDRLFQELEKTRDEITVSHRYGERQEFNEYGGPQAAVQNEGISDLLRSLEERQKPEAPADENPSMTQIRRQADFYAQHAETAYNNAQQARSPQAPQQQSVPDMTQTIFKPERAETEFDLQDYL